MGEHAAQRFQAQQARGRREALGAAHGAQLGDEPVAAVAFPRQRVRIGGARGVLLMQSSGVGNCINMFSLLQSCRIPFLTLVTMRGEYAEFNNWQCPMGEATPAALELMGFKGRRANDANEVEDLIGAALDAAFEGGQQVALLLSQRLIGRKKWIAK